jgi:YHS domain-containing protein
MNSADHGTGKGSPDETPQRSAAKTACGGELGNPENFLSAVHHGEKVYFCMQACLRVFQQDPDPFMAGEIEHPIVEDAE